MSFANKVFVVTGANSGMGYDTAKYLASEGAKVYITGRNADAIAKAAAELGDNVVPVVANAASIADSVKLAETIAANGDKLDGYEHFWRLIRPLFLTSFILSRLFVNAGIATFCPFEYVTEAAFDDLFNTNVKGAYFTVQKLLPVLRDGSSVVLNGSYYVHKGLTATSPYTATKAAVNSFAKTLSRDLLPRKIRVNVVNPGPIYTPIFTKTGLPAEALEGIGKQVLAEMPVGRIGAVDDITGYVAFLLSEKSTFILGTELTIDGGMSQL